MAVLLSFKTILGGYSMRVMFLLTFALMGTAAHSQDVAIPQFDMRNRCYFFTQHSAESATSNPHQEADFADCMKQEQNSLAALRSEWATASYTQKRRCIDQDRTQTYFMFEQCVRFGF